ncbi:hypothetical protein CHU95_05315 [Niveispirillum lacus]|uniref:TtsA-like Glycoside hydrolase family 108 domain-containing protein n=1 Tax=Niveispirillum lacus TaxID=1981099 RepID=A0A255Z6E8_9PROT|nr:glycosyl hydrolase 108 family protein [Niveispirillum lacus]OYQ36210.1 hypothetical protein CHU95_05315 [Niveispirillum lacus]
MADFSQFLPIVLRNEGGWVDNPHDPGGATNKGITFYTFKKYAHLLNMAPTLANLKKMTDEQAGRIYKVEYWDPIFGDEIQYQNLANIFCDFHVNAGYHAIELFVKILNTLGNNYHPSRLTRRIMSSLNDHDSTEVYMEYKSGRISYYRELAQEHPVLRVFLKGWIARVNSFPDVVVPGRTTPACETGN